MGHSKRKIDQMIKVRWASPMRVRIGMLMGHW